MSKQGFRKFICKVEGIPFEKKKHAYFTAVLAQGLSFPIEDIQRLPESYNPIHLAALIDEVLNLGIGGFVEEADVDSALVWHTHILEYHFAGMDEGDPITPEVYAACLEWSEHPCEGSSR